MIAGHHPGALRPARDPRALVAVCLALGVADVAFLNLVVVPRVVRAPSPGAPPPAVVATAPALQPTPAPPPVLPAAAPVAAAAPVPEVPAPTLEVRLHFGTGEADLNARARAALAAVAARTLRDPAIVIAVEGHADSRGDAAINERLSLLRAQAVARLLRARGVPASRLEVRAFGATRPAAEGDDPHALRRNRRAEIFSERGSP
jgi:OOP family OmpA-OmpF porin